MAGPSPAKTKLEGNVSAPAPRGLRGGEMLALFIRDNAGVEFLLADEKRVALSADRDEMRPLRSRPPMQATA